MKSKNLGFIHVSCDLLDKDQRKVGDYFHAIGFIPIKISNNFVYRRMEYLGVSPKFEDVVEGHFPPLYTISVSKDNEATVTNEGVQIGN